MSTHAIHHVTAVSAKIGENMKFYTSVLGLRLVKRSVNQDDVSAYHLFYADTVGSPGTDMTFFDWPDIGPNIPGPGTIALTSFLVPSESLDWWFERLSDAGAAPLRDGDARILFSDPEGQRLALVADMGFPARSQPWARVVAEDKAIRGILGVEIESARPESTAKVLTDILGYRLVDDEGTYETRDGDVSAQIRLISPAGGKFGRVGAGGVHHVAFRIADQDEMLRLQGQIEALGLSTSGFVDRYYFQSLYFREPGGVLFELATEGPGFGSDEPIETLGERLALPPFLEPRRAEIEAGLKPLPALA